MSYYTFVITFVIITVSKGHKPYIFLSNLLQQKL
nr:MAG TPA: hypothetical protein [Caudoviricetes sp.]